MRAPGVAFRARPDQRDPGSPKPCERTAGDNPGPKHPRGDRFHLGVFDSFWLRFRFRFWCRFWCRFCHCGLGLGLGLGRGVARSVSRSATESRHRRPPRRGDPIRCSPRATTEAFGSGSPAGSWRSSPECPRWIPIPSLPAVRIRVRVRIRARVRVWGFVRGTAIAAPASGRSVQIGFRESHRLVPFPRCRNHNPVGGTADRGHCAGIRCLRCRLRRPYPCLSPSPPPCRCTRSLEERCSRSRSRSCSSSPSLRALRALCRSPTRHRHGRSTKSRSPRSASVVVPAWTGPTAADN
mmetsp:Transcript_1614/g.3477  ORF Transcript_1614/g.3477 Transcript_1614/m.3477 type:complete len:295 (+) Transcript_1614:866-1750(+)